MAASIMKKVDVEFDDHDSGSDADSELSNDIDGKLAYIRILLPQRVSSKFSQFACVITVICFRDVNKHMAALVFTSST